MSSIGPMGGASMSRAGSIGRTLARAGPALLVALAVAGVAGAAAWAAGGSIGSESPTAIVSAATSAIDAASSAHFSGSGASGGASVSLDLRLAAGKGRRHRSGRQADRALRGD